MEIKFMKLIILNTDGSAPIAEDQLKHIITTGIVASLCDLKGYTAIVKDLAYPSDEDELAENLPESIRPRWAELCQKAWGDLEREHEKFEVMLKTADDYKERMMEGARQLGLQSAKNARLQLELKRTREQLFDEYESQRGVAGAHYLMDEFDKEKPPSNG